MTEPTMTEPTMTESTMTEPTMTEPTMTEPTMTEPTCTDCSGDSFLAQVECSNYIYPIFLQVEYRDDAEYRQCIRRVFQMKRVTGFFEMESGNIADDMDEISRDEWNYDEDAFSTVLDHIFHHTRENDDLIELYKLAATVFFSQDEITGLTVLFSYDYFSHFHKCLCAYFRNLGGDLTANSSFNYLKSMFHT